MNNQNAGLVLNKYYIFIINVETSPAALIFFFIQTLKHQDSLINRTFKTL